MMAWTLLTCVPGQAAQRPAQPGGAVHPAEGGQAEGAAAANETPAVSASGPTLGSPHTSRWRLGMIVTAAAGPLSRLTGSVSVPIDWPEQQVKVVGQDLSPGVTISYKSYKNTARQMVISFPQLAGGREVRAVLTLEIVRRSLGPPQHPEQYVLPDVKKLPGPMKEYLAPSPYIESGHARIKALAGKVGKDRTQAWEKVRAISDYVREKIHYQKDAPLTGVIEALDSGTGDCNQMTSAFIALCRASGIPARTVRIPGHCYPEFYLVDGAGQGYWFSTEAASDQDFGRAAQNKPIIQKGDNYRLGAEPFRFLPERLSGSQRPGSGRPQLKLICEPVTE
jgi:hypothetical protein